MAHYAFLDENNVVTQVIVGKDEDDLAEGVASWEEYYGEVKGQVCKRTSYNTRAGEHIFDGTPFRANYAGIGYTYDPERDAFIPPKPYDSWILNEETCLWQAPIPYPVGGGEYSWNEKEGTWELFDYGGAG